MMLEQEIEERKQVEARHTEVGVRAPQMLFVGLVVSGRRKVDAAVAAVSVVDMDLIAPHVPYLGSIPPAVDIGIV